ncbi:MAG: DUF6055 domain-containing protein [Armatimonadetes bacterium]|nr:DUF6055 domain-containing protein [Armatimonadota bacterium]
MKKVSLMMAVSLLLALACLPALAEGDPQISNKFDEASAPRIEVGGKLLVDLNAEIMLAVDKDQKVNNWFNAGYLWGCFGDFGFAGPKAQYPTVGIVDGVKAVTFSGKSMLVGSPAVPKAKVTDATKANLATPENMYGDGEYAIEVWAYNPTVENDECLVSWGTSYILYPEAKYASAKKWHHIVLVHSGDKDKLYVDGKLQTEGQLIQVLLGYSISAYEPITLGAAFNYKNFTGSIAALRIHEKAITADQIAKNFAGGIKLGTVFMPNVDPATPDDVNWGKSDNPKYKQYFSKHFRMMFEAEKDVNKIMTDEKCREMLTEYEDVYDLYEQMAMAAPIVSSNKKDRGDGIKYKINICINWDGGAFGGFNGDRGCGYPIHAPGIIHAHELGHSYQTQQFGGLAGNWWETHTSWLSKLYESRGKKFNYNNAMIGNAMFFVSNGRDYYHCYHIFEQLGLDPEFGPMFIAKLWNTNGWDAYPFKRAEEIFPNKISDLKDQWVKMARRNITWDYPDAERNPKAIDFRNSRTLLEPIPYEPGIYRCPKDMAPQQFGYVICPLEPQAKTVMVDLGGYINLARGSEWRACLVAVNDKKEARYGDIFAKGKNSMTLQPDEKELYLVVAATPKTMMIEMAGDGASADYRSFEQSQFPFTVRMTGCAPKDVWIPEKPTVAGKAHANGGGFVADSATVAETAYVGPNAQVLGKASVQGKARIEDYAVVKDNAVVRDHAVISGHALVSGNALVRDYAKVRDFGSVTSKLTNFAKVAEHGVNGGSASEFATIKGVSASYGNNYGASIVDGMYAKGNEISKGAWFTWSWATGKNAGELDQDLDGVYAQYLFDKAHPYLALDTFGVTYGYLVGKPTVANGTITLNGKNQFVELQKDVADMHDVTLVFKTNWAGGKNQVLFGAGSDAKNCIYLTPADADGVISFVIVKDGQAQAIKAKSALPTGKMVDLKVMLSEDLGTLYLDDQIVGQNDKMTLNPEDIEATTCYLGRGLDGGYFRGQIDSATVYSIALVDNAPPTPNPAEWRIEPISYSDSSVIMYATIGCDPRVGVEYLFTETTGKGHSSQWQTSPIYEDKSLKAGETYTYTVKMRDASKNETATSPEKSAKFESLAYYVTNTTQGANPAMFVMEAEHFQNKVKGKFHDWVIEDMCAGFRGEGAVYAAPENGPAIGDYMLDAPRLDYRFKVDQPGKYYLWTRGIGRYYRSEFVYVSVDGQQPQKAFPGWQNNTYRWKTQGDANKPLEPFNVTAPGVHTLSVWMGDDASSLDSFILTTATPEEFKPTDELNIDKDMIGKGTMRESRIEKDGEFVRMFKPIDKPEWSSLQPVMVSGTSAVMQAKDYSDRMRGSIEYNFEETSGSAKSSGWQKEPYCEFKDLAAGKEYAFHYKMRFTFNRPGSQGQSMELPNPSDTITAKWDTSKAVNEPANGLTVIEAEHFTNKTEGNAGYKWEFSSNKKVDIWYGSWAGDRSDAPYSGEGYMTTSSKTGLLGMGKTLDLKPRLDYQINFTKAGAHWVWVRGSGEHWMDHIVNVGFDMKGEDWGKIEMNWTGLRWVRSKQFDVAAPGIQTLNIWMTQDALLVDKIIITTDEKYLPSPATEVDPSSGAPNGIGPDETK